MAATAGGIAAVVSAGVGVANAAGAFDSGGGGAGQATQAADMGAMMGRMIQMDMYNRTKQIEQPFIDAAHQVLPYATRTAISAYDMYPTMKEYAMNPTMTPYAQYRLDEGAKALNKQLAARGLLNSGAGLKLQSDYAKQVLNEESEKYWNRAYGIMGLGLSQSPTQYGQAAAATVAGAGANAANYSGDYTMGAANTAANAALIGANTRNSALSALPSAIKGLGSAFNSWGGSGSGSGSSSNYYTGYGEGGDIDAGYSTNGMLAPSETPPPPVFSDDFINYYS